MTASEFAFLALGLVLGGAAGAAVALVLVSRPPSREIRLRVEHDAVPRRAATLSSDAFVTAPAEPARGGPADRRLHDRDLPAAVPGPPAIAPSGRPPEPDREPVRRPALPPFRLRPVTAVAARVHLDRRTPVPFALRSPAPSVVEPPSPSAVETPAAVGPPLAGLPLVAVPIRPERDEAFDALRAAAVAAVAAAATPTAAEPPAVAPGPVGPTAPRPPDDAASWTLSRILRGDHHALVAATAVLAGEDEAQRRPWQAALLDLVRALSARAIDEGWLDIPTGNPFWDAFTIDQCRAISRALSAGGHRYDGIGGWQDDRPPGYRDLTDAVAAAGVDPRRLRAWPTSDEIASLYANVAIAADQLVADAAPTLDREVLEGLVGVGGPERARLWAEWDRARAALTAPLAPD